MVGGEGGIDDVYVISAVTAVPLQSILSIVADSQAGTIEVQLVVGAEIYGMGVSGSRAVHGHGGVIQGEGCILACTNGHPAPLGDVGSGADAVHKHGAAVKSEGLAPEGNTVFLKGNGIAAAYCEIL